MKKLTPLRCIRKYCLIVCMNNQRNEVKLCPTTDCPFYPFRFGKGRPKLKNIRLQCLDCAGSSNEVKNCPNDFVKFGKCPLWEYRLGHRPQTPSHNRGSCESVRAEKPILANEPKKGSIPQVEVSEQSK